MRLSFLLLLFLMSGVAVAQTIDADITIGYNLTLPNDLVITNGAIVTINNSAVITSTKNIVIEDGVLLLSGGNPTLRMGNDRTIKIRTKGKLIGQNAIITSTGVGPNLAWRGIGVEGPGSNDSEQRGSVELYNSLVEYSRYGIGNYQLPYQGAKTGGSISCYNTTFRNNGRSIEGLQDNFINAELGDALIALEDCNFEIDQDFLALNINFLGMATFWRNMGLDIRNCNFTLAQAIANNDLFEDKHGLYLLQSFGDVTGCRFSNLSIGLEVDNKDAPNIPDNGGYLVVQNNFINNSEGCIIRSDDMVIWNNLFEINRGQTGLVLRESTGYNMSQQNDFIGISSGPDGIGVQVSDSGDKINKVENAYFQNLQIGVLAVGSNRGSNGLGLGFSCNTFIDYSRGAIIILNSPNGIGPQGIASVQATNQQGSARNFFSTNYSSGYDIANYADNPVQYRFFNSHSCSSPYRPCNTVGVTLGGSLDDGSCGKGITPSGEDKKIVDGRGKSNGENHHISNDGSQVNTEPLSSYVGQQSINLLTTNPFSSVLYFNINSTTDQVGSLQILSFTGQEVAQKKLNLVAGDNQVRLRQLAGLPPGPYAYRLLTAKGEIISGVVIKQ